jgi:Raf kinase inhibitor-like YbhB/YbcL family protein
MKSMKGFLARAILLAVCAYLPPALETAVGAMALQVHVPGLKTGDMIPQKFAYNHAGCSGENVSPEIVWSGVPASAKSLALVVWDQDAPVTGGFYHWVILNLPIGTKRLSEGAGNVASHQAPAGSIQLVNDWGEPGYGGPCPPGHSQHHYHFILYALGVDKLPVDSGTRISEAAALIKKNAVASADLVLTYSH